MSLCLVYSKSKWNHARAGSLFQFPYSIISFLLFVLKNNLMTLGAIVQRLILQKLSNRLLQALP